MSQSILSNASPGFLLSDRKCLQYPAAYRGTAISTYLCHGDHKRSQGSNGTLAGSLSYDQNRRSFVCNLNSNNRRRNPDFSRQQKGSSRGKSRPFQERETQENLEQDPASKNGSLFSLSGNQRGQATAKPGQREKEIVELFRKVQAQLRARAAIKEEKKTEATLHGQQQGERGTVDSLLKLLRKHSIDQDEKGGEEDFSRDQGVRSNSFEGGQNLKAVEEVHEPAPVTPSRPVSSFKRRSPVSKVRFQPVFSAEEDGSSTSSFTTEVESVIDEQDLDTEPFDGPGDAFSADPSDTSDTEEIFEETTEVPAPESTDLSFLKLTELREIAKSRGMKGYSKLKKAELVALLNEVRA